MVSKQKQVDMSRGILQLEMEVLEWNRKMLIDHMGYSNYRDINAFIDMLISNKHVKSSQKEKILTIDLLVREKYGFRVKRRKPIITDETAAAGDNISILIDRFSCNWGGRLPLEEEYTKYTTPFLRQRVPWLISDEFYLYGVNRQGSHEVFPGTTNPLNGWHNSSSSRTARDRYLSLSIEELLLQEV